jgi:hypothetical protein
MKSPKWMPHIGEIAGIEDSHYEYLLEMHITDLDVVSPEVAIITSKEYPQPQRISECRVMIIWRPGEQNPRYVSPYYIGDQKLEQTPTHRFCGGGDCLL